MQRNHHIQRNSYFAFVLIVVAIVSHGGTIRVAHPEMYATEAYPLVCGRDYWTFLSAESLTCGQSKEPLAQLPLFTDSATVYTAADAAYKDDRPVPQLTNEFGRTRHHLEAIERHHKQGKPFAIVISNRRNRKVILASKPELDIVDYRRWKAAHPDFFVFRSTGEMVNDLGKLVRQAADDSRWAKYKNGDRYVTTKAVEDLYQTEVDLHFGDASACIGFRGFGYSADFIAAANGARAIVGETTGTAARGGGEWRWNVSPMFLRGAGRQFGIPWMWYVALFVNGYSADGMWQNESWPKVLNAKKGGKWATDGGISASLYRRVNYFAYLTGANALEPEGWNSWGLQREESGRIVLSAHGESLREIHDFAAAHPDRGLPYCPVAILVPYNQGYSALGGVPYRWYPSEYRAGDNLVDGIFFTLMPGRDQDAAFRRGEEGFLRNSPFAQMYDVMVPDSPQSEDAFVRALSRYPVAILTGEYPNPEMLRPKLKRYLKAGGTLIVPKALSAAVPRGYSGKGRVIVSSSKWMTPEFTKDSLADTLVGKMQFPELKALFAALEGQLFPVKIKGNVLYGLNRSKDHDWIWCINNRGVTQFTDTFEKIDPTASETVTVDLRGQSVRSIVEIITGNAVAVEKGMFSFTIPAGGIAVFEVVK